MDGQKIIIDLKDDCGRLLGILHIKAHNPSQIVHKNFQLDESKFFNVPRVDLPDNITPIQYLDSKEVGNLSALMLLEETKYDIMFETTMPLSSGNNVEIFPTIQKENTLKFPVFDQSPYDMISDSGSRFIGSLNFHSYVGKSFIDVDVNSNHSVLIPLEVRSKKIKYYEQYPQMIGDLSEIASGLIYEMDAPLYQYLKFHPLNRETFYEDFMFLEYLFRPENLPSAYDYIVRNLYSHLISYEEDVPTTFADNVGPSEVIDIISRPEHLYYTKKPPVDWPAQMNSYVPHIISQRFYEDSIDTSENRLLKYFLESLDKVVNDLLCSIENTDQYIKAQLVSYQKLVQNYLSDRWIKEVGRLDYLPLNSQILQKKEGYRNIFKYFLNFELTFRLEWQDIEDQIKGFEHKLSELYEYWCYFKLLKVLDKLSHKKINFNDIYELNKDKWSIKVKKGVKSVQNFSLIIDQQEIYAELMYNRLFSKKSFYKSYSLPFRPDYTLLIQIDENPYLIHFDAKYRSEGEILSFYGQIGSEKKENEEKIENEVDKRDKEEETYKKFKFGDLYKMHTYKDAILKTEGAYVLYPGDDRKIFEVKEGEAIPSVGAFPLTPGKNGKEEVELTKFINAVVNNLKNRRM